MDHKYQEQVDIGIARIRRASYLHGALVNRLHTKYSSESEEEWIKTMRVIADCIQVNLNELQSALKKLKGAVSKVDDPDDSPQLSVVSDTHKEVVKM